MQVFSASQHAQEKFGSNTSCNLSNAIQAFFSEMFEVLEVGVVTLGGMEAYGGISSSSDDIMM